MYLLDTNACIHLLNGTSDKLRKKFLDIGPGALSTASVVKAELYCGARKSKYTNENLRLLGEFFQPLRSLPFDDLAAEHYGQIRADLEARGALIGVHDLMIAATARSQDLTVVTHNLGEFNRIIGLRTEDWQQP